MQQRRSRQGWALAGGLALVLVISAAPAGASADQRTADNLRAVDNPPATAPTRSAAAAEQQVVLVTGDRVLLEELPGGQLTVTVDPADRDGAELTFDELHVNGQTYVIPSDALPLVPDVLDRELFNVTKLADYGYTNGVPTIVSYDSAAASTMTSATGVSDVRALPSIDAAAATIHADGSWWRASQAVTGVDVAGVDKVWLDELSEVALDESAPLIGAPEAWAAGFDGSGVTIAVLDTGIDDEHPDMAGRVVATESFIPGASADDGHGHGTHVASIAAGNGTASGGQYTGVAPGANLLVGKICDDNGSCPISSIIAGMEWAATQGADVANLSIGGTPSDGTDPLSMALNTLADEYGTLFVVAAGNIGFLGDQSVTLPGTADAALTVGAINKSERLANFSGRGPRLGDFAIKPDVVAPGVNIVAALAEGTELGSPVDDDYTMASGTSMATPHVAGAAAILLQQNPALTWEDLKSALITTASPLTQPVFDPPDVYEQGGGRIDLPTALNSPLRAAPAPLNLGYFPYPQEGLELVTEEVTYTNRTDEDVAVELTLQMAGSDGEALPEGTLSVEPSSLTIGPRETATVEVTVDVPVPEYGLYGGYLVAEAAGEVAASTPVGFLKESERYDLTVTGITRDGRQAGRDPGGGQNLDTFHVVNVHDATAVDDGLIRFNPDGTRTVRVPPGTYHVMGVLHTYFDGNPYPQERAFVSSDPEVVVTEDTSVVLDAREANRITVETPDHPEAAPRGSNQTIRFTRVGEDSGTLSWGRSGHNRSAWAQYAVETEPVTLGGFEFSTDWRISAPQAALEVVEPQQRKVLSVNLMTCCPSGDTPPVDGDFRLPLVDAGDGAPEDYEGLDAEGALVLTRRGALSHASMEFYARQAGAVALVVANNVPGHYPGGLGAGAQIPGMTVSQEDGEYLRGLAAEGDVTVRLYGENAPSYRYHLPLTETGQVPPDLRYTVRTDELAAVTQRFHSDIPDHSQGFAFHTIRRWTATSLVVLQYLREAPRERVDYFVGQDDIWYIQSVFGEDALRGQLSGPIRQYEPGEQYVHSWSRQVVRPGVLEGGPYQADEPTFWDGDTLAMRIREWVDSDGHWGSRYFRYDTSQVRLYRDDELLGEADIGRADYAVGAQPGDYRIELDVERDVAWWTTSTETDTTWHLPDHEPVDGASLPLLLVDYDVEVDLLNTAPHPSNRHRPGPNTVGLTVRHQPGAEGPAIADARLWISYDDGATWRPRPVRELGAGRYEAILPSPDPADTSGFASVQVEAWDVDGNRIEQEITRAWKLAPR